ncbi:di-heme-cytochrome C peroxidase [Isosphaeraceae bacterium EP7]
MVFSLKWLLIALAIPSPLWAADNPRHVDLGPGLNEVKTLEQNWDDALSNWFYNVPQGSRLLPYDWYINLEQPSSQELFNDPSHIRALGYIPRKPDPSNPNGLPIGFIKDAPYEDRTAGLGLTCAACHTSQINFKGTAYLIDGGPTMGNVERLLRGLTDSLNATAGDDAKFERFATRVLPAGSSEGEKVALRAGIRTIAADRQGYNDRNLPSAGKAPFGPGRVDAFGSIFNEVSVTFLEVPENHRPANAPVSFPCLWDAPQHDRVQWNGAAENKVSPLGKTLFGTDEVGALGRNSGEVLGVFGNATVNKHELLIPRPYDSTVEKANLIKIEQSLKSLWSPLWPEDTLGKIDLASKLRGEAIYKANCIACHDSIVRDSGSRKVTARLSDEGTDQNMIRNFAAIVKTGRLKGRQKTLTSLDRFAAQETRGVILKHVVERVILDPSFSPLKFPQLSAEVARNLPESLDSLNPGYRMQATIDVGDKTLVGNVDSLIVNRGDRSVTVGGGNFELLDKAKGAINGRIDKAIVDLRSRVGVSKAAAGQLNGVVKPEAAKPDEQDKVSFRNATAKVGYKARPLNGIWATAPYLHNGSIPSLAELLKSPADRVKSFHVGSQEYDPEMVGFKDDASQPVFDTTADGNSNAGHDYGGKFSENERADLLEYLKAL